MKGQCLRLNLVPSSLSKISNSCDMIEFVGLPRFLRFTTRCISPILNRFIFRTTLFKIQEAPINNFSPQKKLTWGARPRLTKLDAVVEDIKQKHQFLHLDDL